MRRSQSPLVALGALCSLASFAVPAPAAAQNLDLPTVPLPSGEPTGPSLWFSATDLPAQKARRTSATVGAAYAATRAYVDGRLAALATNPASLNDDSLTQFAKGAALLQALGEVPAASFSGRGAHGHHLEQPQLLPDAGGAEPGAGQRQRALRHRRRAALGG